MGKSTRNADSNGTVATDPAMKDDGGVKARPARGKPKYSAKEHDRLLALAVALAEPVVSPTLDLYVTVGAALGDLLRYDYATKPGEGAGAFDFDETVTEFTTRLDAEFFALSRPMPTNWFRVAEGVEKFVLAGIPRDVAMRIPYNRMLKIFTALFILKKETVSVTTIGKGDLAKELKTVASDNAKSAGGGKAVTDPEGMIQRLNDVRKANELDPMKTKGDGPKAVPSVKTIAEFCARVGASKDRNRIIALRKGVDLIPVPKDKTKKGQAKVKPVAPPVDDDNESDDD